MNKYDVLHLSTVHPRVDVRITEKELYSLSTTRWKVGLVVADGLGTKVNDVYGFGIEDVGRPGGGRIGRFIVGIWRVLKVVQMFKPVLVHFHDPELLPLGFILKCLGYKVIYDVHEDVPRQVIDKHWIPKIVRPIVSIFVEGVEWIASRIFDSLVTATPKIAERFPDNKTVVVRNYPRLEEFVTSCSIPYAHRPFAFGYVGGITVGRGIHEMINAVNLTSDSAECKLELAGLFKEPELQHNVQGIPGWSQVRYHGWTSRQDVAELLGNVRAGLLVLHPLPNHTDSYPIKLFEYMACGLPVIASDFPLWRYIISDVDCGLFVNPMEPHSIANAMQWILNNPEEAEAMGQRGRKMVEEVYNWKKEGEKLIGLYRFLLTHSV